MALFVVNGNPLDYLRHYSKVNLGDAFPYLSDPDQEVARAYGVATKEPPLPRRWTFYIDRDGVIRHLDRDVSPTRHGENIVRQVQALGWTKAARDNRGSSKLSFGKCRVCGGKGRCQ